MSPAHSALMSRIVLRGRVAIGTIPRLFQSFRHPADFPVRFIAAALKRESLWRSRNLTVEAVDAVQALKVAFFKDVELSLPRTPGDNSLAVAGAVQELQSLQQERSRFLSQPLPRDSPHVSAVMLRQVARLLRPDVLLVLAELQRQHYWQLALRVHSHIRQEPWFAPDPLLSATMVRALGAAGRPQEAVRFFASLAPEEGGLGGEEEQAEGSGEGGGRGGEGEGGGGEGGEGQLRTTGSEPAAQAGGSRPPSAASATVDHGPSTALVAVLLRHGRLAEAEAVLRRMRAQGVARLDLALGPLAEALQAAGRGAEAELLREERRAALQQLAAQGQSEVKEPRRRKRKYEIL